MYTISADFAVKKGKMKPMHAVNNGPVHKLGADQRVSNLQWFKEAGIPYQRTHDTSHCSSYGASHVIDVHAIFPNFDADVYNSDNYDFTVTDYYLMICELAGVKTFYRLGSSIEHWVKKYNTVPPKDFNKWAVICEHIIRHYTEGWANGYKYDIQYWEIWNEPDLDDAEPDMSKHKTWGGTKEQFFEFYHIVATHLKSKFPHLKIGGPALAFRVDWGKEFLKQLKAPLDFFSWHCYHYEVSEFTNLIKEWRATLDEYGYKNTESICNEWNYVCGWTGDKWIHTLKSEKNIKGASFVLSVMCEGQKGAIDMLMYYDARPSAMNGLFSTDIVSERLKGYYVFYMFNRLYKLGEQTECSDAKDIYTCSASNGREGGVVLSHYNDDGKIEKKEVSVELSNMPLGKKQIAVYMLDKENDCTIIKSFETNNQNEKVNLDLPLYSCCLVEYKIV